MSFTVIIENQIRSHTGLVLWQWRGMGRGLGGGPTHTDSVFSCLLWQRVEEKNVSRGGRKEEEERDQEYRNKTKI